MLAIDPMPGTAQSPTRSARVPVMSMVAGLPDSLPSDGRVSCATSAFQPEWIGKVWMSTIRGGMVPSMFTISKVPEWHAGTGLDLCAFDTHVEARRSSMW